ncbi:hypothetical protein FRC06_001566, partial [Ceratobasidium sp. 370]
LEQTRILAVPTSAFANIEAKLTCYPTTGRLISSLAPPVSPTQPCVSPSPKQLVLPTISKAAPLSPPSKQPSPTPETVLSQTLPEQLTGDQSESVHYYFVLEEEFDAIPLISYLGLNHERTICYVPSPESMKLYQSIFQTITKLTVVSPTAMGDANQTQARLASASKPTMLVQFYWALHSSALQRSGADASICWGVPTDVESYMNGAAKSVAHSYLILSTKEYNDPVVRTSLSRFGISKHPSNDSFNDCSDNSPLAPMRQKTMAHFKPAEFSATAATLYYCFISYYSLGRGRPKGMTPENVVRAANTYAAKSLLRGKPEDGSKRYPPVASRPSLASKAAKAFKLDGAKRMALAAEALSKAAQAMSAVARVMAAASQDFGEAMETGDVAGESTGEHLEDNATEATSIRSSDDRASVVSTEDIAYDDDDDFALSKTVSSDPIAAPHDPSVTAPCSGGPMDISQIRFTPHQLPPDPQTATFLNPSVILIRDFSLVSKSTQRNGLSGIASSATGDGGDQVESHTTIPSNGEPASLSESTTAYPKLPWGRNYIQLEEDFDALPIISCMALASKKTICLVPSAESLGSYKKILGSITNLHVFSPMGDNSPERIERALQIFTSAISPAIFLLAFQAIPYVGLEKTSADCIIHWGWPENRQEYLKQLTLMKLHTRSCLILPSGDHLKPLTDSHPSNYGVVKYPDVVLSSYFGPEAPIHEIRKVTAQVLADTDDDTMKTLYHSWLDYYGMGSTRRGDWTVVNLMHYAREYAAKTLLRGPASDGSKLYPPTCRKQLPIPAWVISALDAIQPVPPQPSVERQPEPEAPIGTPGQAQPTNATPGPSATPGLTQSRKIER